MSLELLSDLNRSRVAARHMFREGYMALLFDELLGLEAIVKVELDLTQAFLKLCLIVNSLLAKLGGELFVGLELVASSDFNIAVLLGFTAL